MATFLITGGTGSFGQAMTRHLLTLPVTERVVIYSRDELKQHDMAQTLPDPRVRFFLGDVRDRDRLTLALRGVRTVIHAAALKQVPACEYNPTEAVKTNVLGTMHLVEACLAANVERVLALSTDKASAPLNLYGATKAVLERLVLAANAYSGLDGPRFSVVRYGNVAGSRGSVIPVWRDMLARGDMLPVTDGRMTRFWFTLPGAVRFVEEVLGWMQGGELVVPKLPSFKVTDLAEAMCLEATVSHGPGYGWKLTGLRPGEKLHEAMVSADEAVYFRDAGPWYVRDQRIGDHLPDGFSYTSGSNTDWLDTPALRAALREMA